MHIFPSLSLLRDRRNVDIVVVRAMADKRKLQGKTVGKTVISYVAQDPSHWHSALRTMGFYYFLLFIYEWPSMSHWSIYYYTELYLLTFISTGEIDRCLKKVSEGVEQFEDIWQKVRELCISRRICYLLLFKTYVEKFTLHIYHFLYLQFSYTMQPMQTRRKNMRLISRKRLKNYR